MKSPFAVPSVLALAFVCNLQFGAAALHAADAPGGVSPGSAPQSVVAQTILIDGAAGGKRFDGIGMVNGGGATSVLLKDYPEPQRSQILDLVYKPKFGASVSTLMVEIPGDGNSTQGSMPSHMRTRDDLDYTRGYTWWILREAKARNPKLSLDAAAWSAPGWIGGGEFWSQDAADYYVKWLQGLRDVHGLRLDAIGCRNEKGVSFDFAKKLRASLDANGFDQVRIHAFDDWPRHKLDFVKHLLTDEAARDAIDIIGAHVFYGETGHASAEVQAMAAQMGKPIWNTEDHVYLKGFDCLIGIVECFNDNFLKSGATKVVNWYDIAGVYPMEPYSEDPATILAHQPWSGHYRVREALWGYAHYGQFSEVGWTYLDGACRPLDGGGSVVTLKSPGDDYSVIVETKDASAPQRLRLEVRGGLADGPLCVWRSDAREQFVRLADLTPADGAFTIELEPASVYSLSTTTGQQKGAFADIPAPGAFPFPYRDDFETYSEPARRGHLPRYTADIEEVFELTPSPDGKGSALRQVIPAWPISWAPSWRPYTILGDDAWRDYEVEADVWLQPGESAGIMGRVNHVGTGYGTIPKGYFLQLAADGRCELVVVRGKKEKKALVGDAEQQAKIKAMNDSSAGGEKVLAATKLAGIAAGKWHALRLRFDGERITAFVDGMPVLEVADTLYGHGMAGLLAGPGEGRSLSRPFYDNLVVRPLGASASVLPSTPAPAPLYPSRP